MGSRSQTGHPCPVCERGLRKQQHSARRSRIRTMNKSSPTGRRGPPGDPPAQEPPMRIPPLGGGIWGLRRPTPWTPHAPHRSARPSNDKAETQTSITMTRLGSRLVVRRNASGLPRLKKARGGVGGHRSMAPHGFRAVNVVRIDKPSVGVRRRTATLTTAPGRAMRWWHCAQERAATSWRVASPPSTAGPGARIQ